MNHILQSLLILVLCLSGAKAETEDQDEAPIKFYKASDDKLVEGRYIVVLKDTDEQTNQSIDIDAVRDRLLELSVEYKQDFNLERTFRKALRAFSLQVKDDGKVINALETARERGRFKLQSIMDDIRVDFIEEVQLFQSNTVEHQTCATWGLDRLDQRERPLDQVYSHDLDGEGVTAYIIDSGIRSTHDEFEGRVECGFNAFDANFIHLAREDCEDYSGHGTHVAGTVGGKTYGVAKAVNLVTVKVLDQDGSGSTDGVLGGVEWVVDNASKTDGPHVANLSLGSEFSESLNKACSNGVVQGVFMAVAAGNEDIDACLVSPAASVISMTVGASDRTDRRASFSNSGKCVDIFGPGVDITSASHCSDTQVAIKSGTSMASPHVAGVAALYFQKYPDASALGIKQRMLRDATQNIIKGTSGSPNLMVTTVVVNNSTDVEPLDGGYGFCLLPDVAGECALEPDNSLSWWGITLLVLASLAVCFCVGIFLLKMLPSKSDSKLDPAAEPDAGLDAEEVDEDLKAQEEAL